MENEFKFIGYDIRVAPDEISLQSADANIWEQDIEAYGKARLLLGIEENFFQLLNPLSEVVLNKLCHLVNKSDKRIVLILLAIENSAYMSVKNKVPSLEPVLVNNISFSFIGSDICDIDGFFSVFDMRRDYFHRDKLLDEKETKNAITLINLANKLIPSHSPFHLVKLYKVNT